MLRKITNAIPCSPGNQQPTTNKPYQRKSSFIFYFKGDNILNEQEIDLLELWQVLNNNKRKIAYITGGFIALACAYLIIVPPTYQSTSLLRIKQE